MSAYSHIPDRFSNLGSIIIVTGHYGVGKTNFSLNLAVDEARLGHAVTLVDLDIVNPYFRSSDFAQVLTEAGVKLIAPQMAGTALDTPSLSGHVDAAITQAINEPGRKLIFDVGGDDAGATALGRYSSAIGETDYSMLYVLNAFREQVRQAEEAAHLLGEIEHQAHLKATALVNNSHMEDQTTDEDIAEGRTYSTRVSELLDLPLICTTLPSETSELVHSVNSDTLVCDSDYFVRVYVKTPWDVD